MKKIVFILVCVLIGGKLFFDLKKTHPVVYNVVTSTASNTMHKLGEAIASLDFKKYSDLLYDGVSSTCAQACDFISEKCQKAEDYTGKAISAGCKKADDYIEETIQDVADEIKSSKDNSIETKPQHGHKAEAKTSLKTYKIKYTIFQGGYSNSVTAISAGKPKVTKNGKEWTLKYSFPSGSGYAITTDHKISIDSVEEIS